MNDKLRRAFETAMELIQASEPEPRYEPTDNPLERTGIPKRFMRVKPYSDYNKHLIQGRNLYICGGVGIGKTYLSCAVVKAWVEAGRPAKFISSMGLLSALKSTYSGEGREAEVMSRYGLCRLLVVDDLGKESPTEWALSKLFELVDMRYNDSLPTIITTQYKPAELVRHLGRGGNLETAKAIVSRLQFRAEVVTLSGGDRRMR